MADYEHLDRREIRKRLRDVAQFGICGPGAASMLDIGSDDFLRFFEDEVLDNLASAGGATCKFFEGAYGAGKSHLLQLIQGRAHDRGFATVYAELGRAVTLSDWKSVAWHILRNLRMDVGGQEVRSLGGIVSALCSTGEADTEAMEARTLPHGGMRKALLTLASQECRLTKTARTLVEGFVDGNRVSVVDLRRNGVHGVKGCLSQRNAELVLCSGLTGLHLLSGKGAVLFFDENEKSFVSPRYTPSQKVRRAANLMRRFIDSCASGSLAGVVSVFAVLPDFLENCGHAYPALGQRLEADLLHQGSIGWRSPVLRVSHVSETASVEAFLDQAADVFAGLVEHCGGPNGSTRDEFYEEGLELVQSQAGSSYRRVLMKGLATTALRTMNHGT